MSTGNPNIKVLVNRILSKPLEWKFIFAGWRCYYEKAWFVTSTISQENIDLLCVGLQILDIPVVKTQPEDLYWSNIEIVTDGCTSTVYIRYEMKKEPVRGIHYE